MKQIDYSYGCVILLSVVCISLQRDPCDSPRPFSNLRQRLPANKVAAETCLQDTYIDEGWYGETGLEIPTDQPKYLYCGTEFPAYIYNFVNNTDVSVQDDYEVAIIYVKLLSGSEKLLTIQTKICGARYRVYNLKRIPATCSSYCVDLVNATDIPPYTAPVAVTVDLTNNRLVFNCNFKQSKEDKLWYAVTWYINDLPINTTEPVETSSDLISQTALHEQQIIDSGTDKVGFKVKCSFRASFRRASSLGLPSRSDNKFIGIEVIITQKSRVCSVVSDPHVSTFAGLDYDHMLAGTFTLFRNTHLQQEIQIMTEQCSWVPGTACICGLAIRAGRQVYEFNHCGGRNIWEIGYTLCDEVDGIFDVRVEGSNYEITLFTKTRVYVNVPTQGYFRTDKYVNVYIYPSNLDYNIADGLCGTLENRHGFFKHRDGTVQDLQLKLYDFGSFINAESMQSFLESWRVPPDGMHLFDSRQIKGLAPVAHPVFHTVDSPITFTDSKTQPTKCAKIRKFRKLRTCKLGSSIKRHDQLNQNRKPYKHVEKSNTPSRWRNGWTEEKARAYCLHIFNRSKAVQLCTKVPNVDQTGPLRNCIADIKLMGDTGFASVAVESIKNKCYHELDTNTTFQDSTSETHSICQQIKEVACVNECSNHGVCTHGICNCKDKYGGIDCSVNIRDAPTVDSVFNNGYCTQNDDCQAISVYGQTFLDTGNTHCKVRAEELFENGVIQDAGEYKHQAYVESISEAICTLPKSRTNKATVIIPKNSSVKVYHISVTNDGNAYSSESPVVVFNSVCQDCNIVGVKVDCSIVDGYCVSGTMCYSNGESLLNNDCFTCSVNGTRRSWIHSEAYRCQDQTKIPVQSRPLWIIGVVLGGASLILLCGFVLIYRTKRKYTVADSTVNLKKADDHPPPPPYTKVAFVN